MPTHVPQTGNLQSQQSLPQQMHITSRSFKTDISKQISVAQITFNFCDMRNFTMKEKRVPRHCFFLHLSKLEGVLDKVLAGLALYMLVRNSL